ncbi:hypothetical protein CLNEO_00770 [Anaerotignum neopropionicum]|uniref:Uncharacterized protein n=1 Tax=Anaerotignum neopropionicum TaxID=36847 RepID=A0A136WHI0_9FIRM|nr:hypothetical protein CLNEO_00770 [Anaerotignum neopropionicum]
MGLWLCFWFTVLPRYLFRRASFTVDMKFGMFRFGELKDL